METGQGWRLGHRPGLDGLRGVAVLLVIGDHAGFLPEPTGQVGVALFFALSGFLITRLILERRDAGAWSYREFLAARAVRLVPAFALMVATVSALLLGVGARPADVLVVAAHALTYTQNFGTSYPLLGAPFAHTWSLAVEEQFYLLWPLVLVAFIRRRRSVSVRWILLAAVASLSIHLVLVLTGTPGNASLPSQAATILIGCALAYRVSPRVGNARLLTIAGTCGLVATVVAAPHLHAGDVWGAAAAGPVAVALICASLGGGAQFLTAPPLRFLGRISYALYLWHFPLLVLTGTAHARLGAVPAVAIATVLAVVSTLLVEEPIRRLWRQGVTSVRIAELTYR